MNNFVGNEDCIFKDDDIPYYHCLMDPYIGPFGSSPGKAIKHFMFSLEAFLQDVDEVGKPRFSFSTMMPKSYVNFLDQLDNMQIQIYNNPSNLIPILSPNDVTVNANKDKNLFYSNQHTNKMNISFLQTKSLFYNDTSFTDNLYESYGSG